MAADIYLVAGLVIVLFAIPAALSAFFDGRAPRVSAIVLVIAGGLILFAMDRKPGGYTLRDIPHAVLRVTAQIIR